MAQEKQNHQKRVKGYVFEKVGNNFETFYKNHLGFELTGAQKRVVKEIRKDTQTGAQMNRLLQGDVGSGKTVVALLTMLLACDNNFQSALMAPTEILATQHYEYIHNALAPLGLEVALLTGSTKTAARKKIHESLQNGDLKILVVPTLIGRQSEISKVRFGHNRRTTPFWCCPKV